MDITFSALAVIALFFVILLIPVIWLHGKQPLKYLKFAGVPIVPGATVFVGHGLQMVRAEHLGKYDYLQMKKYGGVFGICEFAKPVIVVSDPDILKEVLVRQFHNFTDRRSIPMRGLMKLSVFDQRGAEWKRIRNMMTPFFSSAKLKANFSNMDRAADTLVGILNDFCEKGEQFDAESLCSAFTIDVIFASAFGIQIDSQKDTNDPFLSTVRQLSNLPTTDPLFLLSFTFPSLGNLFEKFGITIFPSGYLSFFEKAVKKMIDDRLNSDEQTADFVAAMVKAHQMAEVESEKKKSGDTLGDGTPRKGLTDLEIVAQCLIFILAGWGTTAAGMSFLLHCLAVNQSYQDRVVAEIDSVTETEGKLTYDNVSKLEFLEQCFLESQRLYPAGFRLDREACADVTIGDLRIPQGCVVVVPMWAMQHDPDLWSDPEKFDPDRFSPEARETINQYVFMPFGLGQRNCIGSRFAQIEMKLGVARILREFKVFPCSSTQDPVPLQSGFFVQPRNGLPLGIERRRRN